jgi:hypothetical protein
LPPVWQQVSQLRSRPRPRQSREHVLPTGELFVLEWPDIDHGGGFLLVRRSLEEIDGQVRVKDVKTPKPRRRVNLAPQMLAALREHRKRM